jgi:hypothetical protein
VFSCGGLVADGEVGHTGDAGEECARFHRLDEMRLVSGAQRTRPVLGAGIGGQRDGRRFVAAKRPILSDALHQIVLQTSGRPMSLIRMSADPIETR